MSKLWNPSRQGNIRKIWIVWVTRELKDSNRWKRKGGSRRTKRCITLMCKRLWTSTQLPFLRKLRNQMRIYLISKSSTIFWRSKGMSSFNFKKLRRVWMKMIETRLKIKLSYSKYSTKRSSFKTSYYSNRISWITASKLSNSRPRTPRMMARGPKGR